MTRSYSYHSYSAYHYHPVVVHHYYHPVVVHHHYGSYGGGGFGSSFAGAFGGSILGNMLSGHHTTYVQQSGGYVGQPSYGSGYSDTSALVNWAVLIAVVLAIFYIAVSLVRALRSR